VVGGDGGEPGASPQRASYVVVGVKEASQGQVLSGRRSAKDGRYTKRGTREWYGVSKGNLVEEKKRGPPGVGPREQAQATR